MPTKKEIVSTAELLILPDGQVLANNLTPALAAVLAGLNRADPAMAQRAGPAIKRSRKSRRAPTGAGRATGASASAADGGPAVLILAKPCPKNRLKPGHQTELDGTLHCSVSRLQAVGGPK
jgi:hypothetical protein